MTTEITTIGNDELEEFETPYVPTVVPPMLWSVEKYEVAQLYALKGMTKNAIAKQLGIPINAINRWVTNPEFMKYVDDLVTEKASKMKATNLRILTKALDAKEAQAELEGYASITRKDTLDIIAEIRKESGEEKTADASYTNLLEKLVLNSVKNQPKIINVETP